MNIVTSSATAFSALPPGPPDLALHSTTPTVIASVRIMAMIGSLPRPLPLAKKLSGRKILSAANACRMRGAPINVPSALESVAAATPAKTRKFRWKIA